MADTIDAANDYAAQLNHDALERARGKDAPEHHPSFNGANCVDCGVVIHPARLAMGKVRCTECQSFIERRVR